MDSLVCPNCGHDEFTQDRPTLTRVTMMCREGRYWEDAEEETVDMERDGDIVCAGCGENVTDDELITAGEYNDGE